MLRVAGEGCTGGGVANIPGAGRANKPGPARAPLFVSESPRAQDALHYHLSSVIEPAPVPEVRPEAFVSFYR